MPGVEISRHNFHCTRAQEKKINIMFGNATCHEEKQGLSTPQDGAAVSNESVGIIISGNLNNTLQVNKFDECSRASANCT